jgi:peptidoglycan/LPS O-acetylase OafA/YrhL
MIKRNETVDILRGISILMVMIYHGWPTLLRAGYIGVDIFFVLSGYVISKSIESRSGDPIKVQLSEFYYRRLYRIVPLLCIVIIVAAFINSLLIPLNGMSRSVLLSGNGALIGLANQFVAATAEGYFAPQRDLNLFHHMWSLGVEEQFYIVAPVLLMYLRKNISATKSSAILLTCIATLFGFLAIASYSHPGKVYLSTFARSWELLLGVACHRLSFNYIINLLPYSIFDLLKQKSIVTNLLWINRILIIVLFLSAILIVDSQFPYPFALIPTTIAGIIVISSGLVVPSQLFWSKRVAEIFSYIGRISYSLYLWHHVVNVAINWTIGLDVSWAAIAGIAISFVLAGLSYNLIEIPSINYSRVTSLNKQWLIPFATTFIAGLILNLSFFYSRALTLSVTGKNREDWYQPKIENRKMLIGEPQSRFTGLNLFVFGDSHAYAYQGIFQDLNKNGASIYIDTEGGRGFNLMRPLDQKGKIDWEQFLRVLRTNGRSGDIVFLPALRVPRLCEPWRCFDKDVVLKGGCYTNKADHSQAMMQFIDAITVVEKIGMVVLIDLPKPVLPSPIFRGSDWFNNQNPIMNNGMCVSKTELEINRSEVESVLLDVAKRCKNTVLWNPFLVLCPDQECCGFREQRPLYFDGDHLSNYGCQVLISSFSNNVVTLLENNNKK